MSAEPAPRRNRSRQAGFALAEVLVSLAIGGAVLLGLVSLTSLVSRHARQVAERVEASERAGRALTALARDIALVQRARWSGPAKQRPFVFRGGPDRLLFVIESGSGGPDVVVQFQSSLQDDALLRAQAPFRPTASGLGALAFEPTQRVFEGAMRIRFAYVKGASATSPETLLDAWDNPDAMPVAVRVSVDRPGSDAAGFSVRVPLRIEAEAGCAAPALAPCSRMTGRDLAGEDAATGIDGKAQEL